MIGLELLNEVGSLILSNLMFHSDSKNSCHKLGYNGFKRWHRYASREDFEVVGKVEAHIVEYFDVKPVFTSTYIETMPTSLAEHLNAWYEREFSKFLRLNDIKSILETNRMYVEAELVQCIIVMVLYEVKKIKRVIKDMENVSYNPHHISIVDMKLHCKYKKKERDKQGKNIK